MADADQVLLHRLPAAHQIPKRLPAFVGHRDQGQFSAAVVAGKLERVAPVGLDPFSWLARSQRRRCDLALDVGLAQPTVQHVAARTCFVDHAHLAAEVLQESSELAKPLIAGDQFELFARLLPSPFELSDGPLVGVIVDPNPMDNLHDPFLLYVALRLAGVTHEKIRERTGHSILSKNSRRTVRIALRVETFVRRTSLSPS